MGEESRTGGWQVDERCTNCDVARQMAPGLIGEADGRAVVLRQPRNRAEVQQLFSAAHACHTRSIRPPAGVLEPATDPYPLALDPTVLLCGHNSRQNAGANSYLVRRPGGTLMMVDTPRWSEALAARYQALGTVTEVLLTHRDHASHGRRYADRFGAGLWIHEGDLDAAPDADRILRGLEPTAIADGVVAVPFPGHTRGSVLYLVDGRYCFSGDSFYWSRAAADLAVADSVVWYSIEVLADSLERTAGQLGFEWVLPGHGDRQRLPAEDMTRRLRQLAARTRELRPRPVDFSAVRW